MIETRDFQAPFITTRATTPQHHFERIFADKRADIEDWLRQQWQHTPAPITCSVDLRNAGFKVTPIDTNLFPAGFNNLNPDFLPLAMQACQATLEQSFPQAKRILLIPESHTRNNFYFENLAALCEIIRGAGYCVQIGTLVEEFGTHKQIKLSSGKQLDFYSVRREGKQLISHDFVPDLVLLNNDFSGSIPELLQDLQQPILPALTLTWAKRLKSRHFAHYAQVAEEFARLIDIDPWLINPLFNNCGTVDFMRKTGEGCLVKQAGTLLALIQDKYHSYGIQERPFLIVKADAGSYGMGVMTVYDPAELQQLNRKQRTRMSSTKSGQQITKIILQEGIPSVETWHGGPQATSEPVVYMFGHYVIGGFYRMHAARGHDQNLNSPGMQFQNLTFATCQPRDDSDDGQARRLYVYGVLARLALVAAAREFAEQLG